MPRCFSIKLHSETQVYPQTCPEPLIGHSEGKRFQQPTMPYHPHPRIIICTSFILSIVCNVFIVLQYHLKDLLCRKVT